MRSKAPQAFPPKEAPQGRKKFTLNVIKKNVFHFVNKKAMPYRKRSRSFRRGRGHKRLRNLTAKKRYGMRSLRFKRFRKKRRGISTYKLAKRVMAVSKRLSEQVEWKTLQVNHFTAAVPAGSFNSGVNKVAWPRIQRAGTVGDINLSTQGYRVGDEIYCKGIRFNFFFDNNNAAATTTLPCHFRIVMAQQTAKATQAATLAEIILAPTDWRSDFDQDVVIKQGKWKVLMNKILTIGRGTNGTDSKLWTFYMPLNRKFTSIGALGADVLSPIECQIVCSEPFHGRMWLDTRIDYKDA